MPLESATHIASLVATNPDSFDDVAQGDDHIRLLKEVLVRDLPLTTPATATGMSVLTAATASAGRTALGAGLIGEQVFVAATQPTARTALGSLATGDALFVAATAASGRGILGSGAAGDNVFIAITQEDARDAMAAAPLDDPVFTTKITTPRIITATGVTTVGSGVAGTIFTAPAGTNAIYVVAANIGLTNDPANYAAFAMVMADGASLRRMSGTDGALLAITISGLTVQSTQTTGTSQTINATITRLG